MFNIINFKSVKRVALVALMSAVLVFTAIPFSSVAVRCTGSPYAASAADKVSIPVSGTNDYASAWEVLNLVNAERANVGAAPLTMNANLLTAAMTRAQECQLVFAHTRPDGTMCYSVSDELHGENIAAGYSSPANAMYGWMTSDGHRRNILDSGYRSIGIGVFKQSDGSYTWVQCFSRNATTGPSKPKNETGIYSIFIDEAYFLPTYAFKVGASDKLTQTIAPGNELKVTLDCSYSDGKWRSTVHVPLSAASWISSVPSVAVANGDTITAKAKGKTVLSLALPGKTIAQVTLTVTKGKAFAKAPKPTISGTAKVGKKLTAKAGKWSPKPDKFTYQWYRGGKAIKGATKSKYKLVKADKGKKITVKVTAYKNGYTAKTVKSKATAKVK